MDNDVENLKNEFNNRNLYYETLKNNLNTFKSDRIKLFMYKNDKTLDINLEIKEIANLIRKRNEDNEDLKQNLSVNKKFKKDNVKEEIAILNESLKSKKKTM